MMMMMIMMDQDDTKYVENYISLVNYKDDDEKKIKIIVSIHIEVIMVMDQDDMDYVGN